MRSCPKTSKRVRPQVAGEGWSLRPPAPGGRQLLSRAFPTDPTQSSFAQHVNYIFSTLCRINSWFWGCFLPSWTQLSLAAGPQSPRRPPMLPALPRSPSLHLLPLRWAKRNHRFGVLRGQFIAFLTPDRLELISRAICLSSWRRECSGPGFAGAWWGRMCLWGSSEPRHWSVLGILRREARPAGQGGFSEQPEFTCLQEKGRWRRQLCR